MLKYYFSIPMQINYDLMKLSKSEGENGAIMVEKLFYQHRQWIDGILTSFTAIPIGKII